MLEGLEGLEGERPRLLEFGGIHVAVSRFEGERVAVERENVFAHERVVQAILRHTTPLPFRFGTLVTDDRLKEYLEANRASLMKSLAHVRDSIEMSVKIIWDAEAIKGLGLTAENADSRKQEEGQPSGKGAAYLAARRKEMLGDELLKERAGRIADWLAESVGDAALDSNVQVQPSESLVIRAAHLVRRERLDDYRQRLEGAKIARPDLRFLTSGPWPPYSFSNINP